MDNQTHISQEIIHDPWNTVTTETSTDWLDIPVTDVPIKHFDIMHPFQQPLIPLDSWVSHAIDWIVLHFRPLFQGIRLPIDFMLSRFEQILTTLPATFIIVCFALLAWQLSNKKVAVATFISLVFIGAIGAWSEAMITLSLVLTSLFFCLTSFAPIKKRSIFKFNSA